MARGVTLAVMRGKFKAICGIELSESISTSEDARINKLLAIEQEWLLGQHAFLLGKVRVDLAVNGRYTDFPATIDVDRLNPDVRVVMTGETLRRKVDFGITQDDYEVYDSEAGQTQDWVRKWDLVNVGGALKVEVWPIPATAQTLKLSGVMALATFTQDAHVCSIDDLAIVLFAAAKYLAKIGDKQATAVLTQAQKHLDGLKATRQSGFENFSMAGGGFRSFSSRVKVRPIVGVSNV